MKSILLLQTFIADEKGIKNYLFIPKYLDKIYKEMMNKDVWAHINIYFLFSHPKDTPNPKNYVLKPINI